MPLGSELQEASNGVEGLKIWGNWQPHLTGLSPRQQY